MQNAQKAKHLQEAEVEQAKVKDDAEWEVPKEVRAAWNAMPTSNNECVSNVCEL